MSESEETPDMVSSAFDEYVDAFRSGHGDPEPFLNRFEGRERQELMLLIEAFIETGPVSNPDPADPRFESVFEKVLAEVDGPSGGLSELLATLRQKAGKTQAAVVAALSKSIQATPAEAEKIDEYYHQLEWGSLPASGLNDKLYSMLGKILQADPESLKEAARSPGSRYGAPSGPIFARSLDKTKRNDDASIAPAFGMSFAKESLDEVPVRPDRIDRLFTGG